MRYLTTLCALTIAGMLSAQCYMDRHNTTWFDAWISCQPSVGPVAQHGSSHWIQYDLGYQYLLGELEIWNINDPLHLDRGAQNIHIDISQDGEEWTALPDQTLLQGSGLSIYEGQTVLDLDGAQARYLLITIIDTYGDDCGGFSEMRVAVEGLVDDISEFETPNACFDVAIYPNPHQENFTARVNSTCGGQLDMELYDATGRLVQSRRESMLGEEAVIELGDSELPPGVYYLSIRQDDALGRYQIVKTR